MDVQKLSFLDKCDPSYETLESASGTYVLSSNCFDSTADSRLPQFKKVIQSSPPLIPQNTLKNTQKTFIERFNTL